MLLTLPLNLFAHFWCPAVMNDSINVCAMGGEVVKNGARRCMARVGNAYKWLGRCRGSCIILKLEGPLCPTCFGSACIWDISEVALMIAAHVLSFLSGIIVPGLA